MFWWLSLVCLALSGTVLMLVWALRGQTRLLRTARAQMNAVALSSTDAICLEDAQGTLTGWSPGAQALFGYSAAEMLGRSAAILAPPEFQPEEAALLASLDRQVLSLATLRLSKTGALLPVSIVYSALHDGLGRRSGVCRVISSNPKQKVADELIRSMAVNDSLTGLPNWRLLRDRLWRAQLNSRRQRSCFAVLYVDLDNFKAVNDRLGHDAGDQLLIDVSIRLMAAVRQIDTVARLGGDEFVVLLEDLGANETAARNHATQVADKILDLLEQREFQLGTACIYCTASIGILVTQGGNGQVDQVIKDADAAMARVKAGRRLVTQGALQARFKA